MDPLEGSLTFQTLGAALSLRHKFPWIAAPTLGMAMLVLPTVAMPLQAQSDQGLNVLFQECGGRVNLREHHNPEFSLGGRGMLRVPGADEVDATPQGFLSFPFTTFRELWEARDPCGALFSPLKRTAGLAAPHHESETEGIFLKDSKESSTSILRNNVQTDRNRSIYYKNKLEFSLEGGWLPVNIPFPFDFLLGSGYNFSGLYYTLVPIIASVRWQLDDIGGPSVLRGNWDVTFSGSVTVIPRGAETRYFSYMMGIRRNFVPRRWRVVPYLDGRAGLGNIDAKGPLGVEYAQGQNFTFTLSLGSGIRYNFNSQYAIQAGMNYMHISNLYLSEPKYLNYGINVYGPWVGIDIRVGKHRPAVQ